MNPSFILSAGKGNRGAESARALAALGVTRDEVIERARRVVLFVPDYI